MSSPKHIVIVSDAWEPQINGVVRTLKRIKEEMEKRGHAVDLVTPDQFHTVPLPGYSEIQLSYASKEKNGTVSEKLDTLHPDQIYIATEGPLGLAAREYCVRRDLNFTSGYHTKFPEYVGAFGFGQPGTWLARQYMHHFHHPARHVLAPSKSMKDELNALGFANARAWTRGVDTELFRPPKENEKNVLAEYKRNGPVFLYVGRVSHEKNLPAFLGLDLPGTKIVVGAGPALDELKNAYPDTVFLGKKIGEELAAIYRAADVFVFPSQSDTLGNVQLEALASGVPVAAFDATGARDIVTNPHIGALAVNGDLKEACMRALALKQGGCEEACVAHVKEHFTWEKAADIFESHLVDAGAWHTHSAARR